MDAMSGGKCEDTKMLEDRERSQEPRNTGGPWKVENGRNEFSPRIPKGKSPCQHLDFSPIRLISDF